MNVKELKLILDNYPDNMEVIVDRHSDYGFIGGHEIVQAVDKGDWLMHPHTTMSDKDKSKEKSYLYLN